MFVSLASIILGNIQAVTTERNRSRPWPRCCHGHAGRHPRKDEQTCPTGEDFIEISIIENLMGVVAGIAGSGQQGGSIAVNQTGSLALLVPAGMVSIPSFSPRFAATLASRCWRWSSDSASSSTTRSAPSVSIRTSSSLWTRRACGPCTTYSPLRSLWM